MEIKKENFMKMVDQYFGPTIRILRQYRSGRPIRWSSKEEEKREEQITEKWKPIKDVIMDYLYYDGDEQEQVQHFFSEEEEKSGDPMYAPVIHHKISDAQLMKTLAEANEFTIGLIGCRLFNLDTDDPMKTGILEYDDCRREYLIQNRDAMNYSDTDVAVLKSTISRKDHRDQIRKKVLS